MSESSVAELSGRVLGDRVVSYSHWEAILYALAVGAEPTDLDLVYEAQLRVLPSFALTLAQWAPDILADEGVFGPQSVHGSQTLTVLKELPRSGELAMSARVGDVWDKGSAAIIEVIVESDHFVATWSIFAPGLGGFGGERGPSASSIAHAFDGAELALETAANQAALYRLCGDHHLIHIDPEAAKLIGQPRPILQGLCTLAAATLPIAAELGAHPADLEYLQGRFAGPAFPGERLRIRSGTDGAFAVFDDDRPVITDGGVRFS